ncbi:hypothetical protein JHK82_033816 [Glycine max]|nr:hypothetical protein JHK86_033897 [Glycine max]KAG5119396.1 hypothetical protein JHK82_033816 [Glycine max]
MLQSLFKGQLIIMHSLQELAHNRPIITLEHFLEQVAWPESQLPLVRPNEAAPSELASAWVEPMPYEPRSPVVNPPPSRELEAVPPSPPLIIISDASSDEAAIPPDSPVGGVANLSESPSGEEEAVAQEPTSPATILDDPEPSAPASDPE